ncbi:uncharacterized protein N7503_009079 [Penicillium pulvis]|uniref:uncharacterized protein n=1 Tax=Penicillium pulvis TaxID=1562058 RepID=UPI002547C290|nr:uncharacterized protein N7503_009079 [Penicillium pulvis]KAJ5793101.1 hypothetical protein N7503_009079 [Penicillium pulvis]
MGELLANQLVVYLSEPYNGTLISDNCYNSITLEVLTPKGPMNIYNCIMLSINDHPYLRRWYIPSREYRRLNPYVEEDQVWVGFNMDYGMYEKPTERDWLTTLKHAIEQGRFLTTKDPKRDSRHSRTFWMQMRGYFKYDDQGIIKIAVERHVDLLNQLIHHKIVTIQNERILSLFTMYE